MHQEETIDGGAVLLPRLSQTVTGWEVAVYSQLDSTNLEAKRRLAQGSTQKCLLIAETQTHGQCRHDHRRWESAPGKGIWASFILPVSAPPEVLPQASLVLAVAVREAIVQTTGVALQTKWPNDLLGEGKKCCGLLVETSGDGTTPTSLILGVGINCNHLQEDFPPYLQAGATSLAMLSGNGPVCRRPLLARAADQIDAWFGLWETQGFAPIREAWLAATCTVGRPVLLPEGYGHSQGVAQDIDRTGALMVRTADGTMLRVDAGEVLFAP